MQLATACAVVVIAYVSLTAKEFLASLASSRPELVYLQRAVRFSPGNADYRDRLGRYFAFVSTNPEAAIQNFQSAVALNPHDASYWFDLASAWQVVGNVEGQRAALNRALEAEPTAPAVAWQAANFFLVDGDIDRALREFRVVIENDNTLALPSLQAAWRILPDADALMRDVVPPRTDSLMALVGLLISKKDTDGAIKAWDRLTELHEKFENWRLFEYVRYLIQERRPEAAMQAWEESAAPLGLSAYLPTDDNLVINGDFSLDILNGGFDWTYVNRTGVKPVLDPSDFQRGHRSLSLTFEGPGIADAGVQQLVPVHGGTTYDFSAYYKSADFEGVGGPQIVLRDAYNGAVLFASEPLRDADFWKEVHSKITTPTSTSLLILAIERFPAGSPIRGKLWLDDFQLSPDTPEDSKDKP